MKKPNNYEETQVQGEFTPVELGGHKLVIKQVEERMSRTNKPMIVVFFDFAPGDKQAGYFAEAFKNDILPEKKWPNQATQYILTEDNEGNCSRSFKTFLTCVEHSNQGFTTQWGDNFGKQFKNKLVGGVFGIQMDYYEGSTHGLYHRTKWKRLQFQWRQKHKHIRIISMDIRQMRHLDRMDL